MVEVSTSILNVKEGEESATFFELETAKTDYFHIDVMDGKFVEKDTYQKMFEYASYITCKDKEDVMKKIQYIKDNHCKVGIAIKPNTKIEDIYEFLPYIHLCLIMTVEPGKGGQTFLSDMVKKIEELKKYLEENNLETDIEVDGGINLKTAPIVKKAGANILVAGTAILMANKFEDIISELKNN